MGLVMGMKYPCCSFWAFHAIVMNTKDNSKIDAAGINKWKWMHVNINE